jgi:hypothetical protein
MNDCYGAVVSSSDIIRLVYLRLLLSRSSSLPSRQKYRSLPERLMIRGIFEPLQLLQGGV